MSFGEDLYGRMEPWAYADEANSTALRTLCDGIGAMFTEVSDLAIATDDLPGWAKVFTTEDAPATLLPWLGQFVGVRIPKGAPDDDARARVKHAEGLTRGTPQSLVVAAQRHLTGSKTVRLIERAGGSAYALTVICRRGEVPPSDVGDVVNLVTNPNFEQATTGWGTSGIGPFVGSGASILRDTAVKYAGDASLKVTTVGTNTGVAHQATKTISAGETYTASFWMRGALGTERIQALLGSSGTDFASYAFSGGTIFPTNDWQRYSVTWTAGGSASAMSLTLRESASGGAPGTVWIDNVQITQTPAEMEYFDGDSFGATWDGSHNASTSTLHQTTRVRDALTAQKPAGLVLTYIVSDGVVWDELVGTWDAQTGVWADFD